LIDNNAFRDLRALVRAGVDAFTKEWYQDRPRPESVEAENRKKKVPSLPQTSCRSVHFKSRRSPVFPRQAGRSRFSVAPGTDALENGTRDKPLDSERERKLLSFLESLRAPRSACT